MFHKLHQCLLVLQILCTMNLWCLLILLNPLMPFDVCLCGDLFCGEMCSCNTILNFFYIFVTLGCIWIPLILLKTENWKYRSKIIFKCVNSAVWSIFNENFVEKRGLWVPWTVHGTHWKRKKHQCTFSQKKKKKRKENTEMQTLRLFQLYPNGYLIYVCFRIPIVTILSYLLIIFQVQPCVGIWSDKCTSKYGRRRPFIFVGSIMISVAVSVRNSWIS